MHELQYKLAVTYKLYHIAVEGTNAMASATQINALMNDNSVFNQNLISTPMALGSNSNNI